MSSRNHRKLGYDSQKSILYGLRVDKRRGLSQICPQIRNLNKMVPYKFDEVVLSPYSYKFDNLYWDIDSDDAFWDLLLRKYLHPGIFIRKLYVKLSYDPENVFISKYGPLNVEEMEICYWTDYPILKDILSVIDKKCHLKKLEIGVDMLTVDILDDPVVQNAENLIFSKDEMWDMPNETIDKLEKCKYKTLKTSFDIFTVEQVCDIGLSWISTKQPIGKKFIMPVQKYTFLYDVIEEWEPYWPKSYMSNIISLGDSWLAYSLSIPINEDAVLVVYGGEAVEEDYKWSFIMEIMKKEDVKLDIS